MYIIQRRSGEVNLPDKVISLIFDASPVDGEYTVLIAFVASENAGALSCPHVGKRNQTILAAHVTFHRDRVRRPFRLVEYSI